MLVSYGALPPGATLMLTTGPLLTLLDVQKSLLWTRNPLGLSSEQDPLGVVPPSFHSHVKTADRAEGVGVARTCSGEWTIPLLLPALPTSHGEQTAMGLECGRSATTHRIDCERTEHPTSLQAVEERRTEQRETCGGRGASEFYSFTYAWLENANTFPQSGADISEHIVR